MATSTSLQLRVPSLAPLDLPIPRRCATSLILPTRFLGSRSFTRSRVLVLVSFALAESSSPKSAGGGGSDGDDDTSILPLLQELADTLKLPPDYLSKLPRDLRLDLNDAAFDLSNGPVLDECGEEVGNLLLNLGRAWEQADTSTSNSIARQLPSAVSSLTDSGKSAFGRRLVSSGKKFQAMGQYGQGEPQRIAKAMIDAGKILSKGPIKIDEKPKKERTFKFGDLQVELTPEKAYTGAIISVVFGALSWVVSQGIQNVPESSLDYANENALQLAKSLRGALLTLFYSSTILSALASVGLVLLGRQLTSESKSKE